MAGIPVDDDTKKQIVLHLDDSGNHGAQVLRSGLSVTVTKIRVQGVIGAGFNGSIVLRKNSVSGPIVYSLAAVGGGSDVLISDDSDFDGLAQIAATGLYLDALTHEWAAGAKMIIYCTRGF